MVCFLFGLLWFVFLLTAEPETYSIVLGHDGYFDYQFMVVLLMLVMNVDEPRHLVVMHGF